MKMQIHDTNTNTNTNNNNNNNKFLVTAIIQKKQKN